MSSMINKRQQARNEKILQDLIKGVPGNDKCADCGTRNPGNYIAFYHLSARRERKGADGKG